MAREAYSLQQLEREIQKGFPGTTTWEVGDKAHQNTWSDHNPNTDGVICAKDVLGDGGLNLRAFVNALIERPHPNLRYVIYKRKIYQRSNGFEPKDYNGVNAHLNHVHVSVGNGPDGRSTSNYDNSTLWGIATTPTTPKPKPPATTGWTDKLMAELPTLKEGAKGAPTERAQALLNAWGAQLKEDGIFGPVTKKTTKNFQKAKKLTQDGIIGRHTWTRLVKG